MECPSEAGSSIFENAPHFLKSTLINILVKSREALGCKPSFPKHTPTPMPGEFPRYPASCSSSSEQGVIYLSVSHLMPAFPAQFDTSEAFTFHCCFTFWCQRRRVVKLETRETGQGMCQQSCASTHGPALLPCCTDSWLTDGPHPAQ